MLNITHTSGLPNNPDNVGNYQNSKQNKLYLFVNEAGKYFARTTSENMFFNIEKPIKNYSIVHVVDGITDIQSEPSQQIEDQTSTIEQNALENEVANNIHNTLKQIIDLLMVQNSYPNLLECILNSYVDQKKTMILEIFYFRHCVFTKNLLDYLADNPTEAYFEKDLISVEAILITDIFKTIIEYCNDEQKKQIIELLVESNLLHKILNHAVDQEKIDIISEIYSIYYFTTKKAINYLLEYSFKNDVDLTFINGLIMNGAVVTENMLIETLKAKSNFIDCKQISNFYTKLRSINIDKNTEKVIEIFCEKSINVFTNIAIETNNLVIVKLLYFDLGIITQKAYDCILALEPNLMKRYFAELLFEKKFRYKKNLYLLSEYL